MRLNLLVAALAATVALGCADGGSDMSDDTDPDTDDDTGNSSADRLGVPEEFKFLWNTTEGCDTADGAAGTQVYWHTSDAKSEERGGKYYLTATETWYWFHGGSGTADCKDTWEITAEFVTTDYDRLGCSECEEAYYFRRELKDQGCEYLYHGLYGYADGDPEPEEPIFNGYFLFDTHNTFNGAPNENNKMLVVARYQAPSGYSLNNSYGSPGMSKRVVDDPDRQGPPGEYVWTGEACVGSGGGGGA